MAQIDKAKRAARRVLFWRRRHRRLDHRVTKPSGCDQALPAKAGLSRLSEGVSETDLIADKTTSSHYVRLDESTRYLLANWQTAKASATLFKTAGRRGRAGKIPLPLTTKPVGVNERGQAVCRRDDPVGSGLCVGALDHAARSRAMRGTSAVQGLRLQGRSGIPEQSDGTMRRLQDA